VADAIVPTFDRQKYDDRRSRRAAAKNAVEDLDTVIAGVEGSTARQTQTAVKQIARNQQRLIALIVGSI